MIFFVNHLISYSFNLPPHVSCRTDIPTAPLNVRPGEVRADGVQLDWTKPRSDGGSTLTSYIIERRETSSNYWAPAGTVDGTRSGFNVTGLRAGTEYQFRVFAENEMGVSEPCTLSVPIRLSGGVAGIVIFE